MGSCRDTPVPLHELPRPCVPATFLTGSTDRRVAGRFRKGRARRPLQPYRAGRHPTAPLYRPLYRWASNSPRQHRSCFTGSSALCRNTHRCVLRSFSGAALGTLQRTRLGSVHSPSLYNLGSSIGRLPGTSAAHPALHDRARLVGILYAHRIRRRRLARHRAPLPTLPTCGGPG